jgi:hypothetical protein
MSDSGVITALNYYVSSFKFKPKNMLSSNNVLDLYSVRILVGISATLTGVFRGFTQSLWANIRIVP